MFFLQRKRASSDSGSQKRINHDHSYHSRQNETETKKKKLSCCMKGCENTNGDHVMFHFPNTITAHYGEKVVHESNFRR